MKNIYLLPIILLLASCATQAQLVDLENSIAKLELQQESLSKSVTTSANSTASVSGNASGSNGAGLLKILSRIDELDANIRNNSGLWEENSNYISEIGLRIDNVNSDISEIAGRLQTVETGLLSIEKTGPISNGSSVASPTLPTFPSDNSNKLSMPGRLPGQSMTSIEAYNLAYRDYMRGNYVMAIQGFESFNTSFPDSSLAHQAQYWIGDAYYEQKEFQKAVSAFEKLIALYPDSDKISSAMLKESFALLEMGDVVKSEEYLKQIIERFPLAKESKLAKEKLSELR